MGSEIVLLMFFEGVCHPGLNRVGLSSDNFDLALSFNELHGFDTIPR